MQGRLPCLQVCVRYHDRPPLPFFCKPDYCEQTKQVDAAGSFD
jgi:hypothetical protein